MAEPLFKLDPQGNAPILSYNVPEPSRYSGHTLFELILPRAARAYFKPELFGDANRNPQMVRYSLPGFGVNLQALPIRARGNVGTSGLELGGNIDFERDAYLGNLVKSRITEAQMQLIEDLIRKGTIKEIPFNDLYGNEDARYIPSSSALKPRLIIIEHYKLSTYLGSYGAGKTLNTFSLLPGEKTVISIKTYKSSETTSSQASTIFDSFNQESAKDFEQTVGRENSIRTQDKSNFEYHVEAEASCNFGNAGGKVSGGVAGGNNSQREEMSKSVMNAASKHAAKASAKRDVTVNTTSQSTVKTGEETSIIREIENINVGRTLNFVFRQMNQEFISILHLTDIRIGFTNGEVQFEYKVSEIEKLIDDLIINDQATQLELITILKNQLLHIRDYQDNVPIGYDADGNAANKPFIEEKTYFDVNGQPLPNQKYLKFARERYSLYTDASGNRIFVPGVILAVEKNTIRTDGVIIDAILGQGEGLDKYSKSLQDETIKEKEYQNELIKMEAKKIQTGIDVIGTAKDQANAFKEVFGKNDGDGTIKIKNL